MEKVIVGAVIAVTGWLIAHFSKLHFEKRTAKLARVNAQLEHLYGPLMATLAASNKTWLAFVEKHWPKHGMSTYFGEGKELLSEEELERWRIWITYVFHPLNERVEKIIIENIHLIESEEIPAAFTEALSHVSAYRAVIAQWNKGNFSEHLSVNNWPTKNLKNTVIHTFKELSAQQTKLLGKKHNKPLNNDATSGESWCGVIAQREEKLLIKDPIIWSNKMAKTKLRELL